MVCVVWLWIRQPPISTRTNTLLPSTSLFRSVGVGGQGDAVARGGQAVQCQHLHVGGGVNGMARQQPQRGAWGVMRSQRSGSARAVVIDAIGHRADDGFDLGAADRTGAQDARRLRSEEPTSELQSLMRISYAVFCLKKKKILHI